MSTYHSIVLNLDEIWLKGLNRKFYIKTLRKNIRKTIKAILGSEFKYSTEGPKHILSCEDGFPEDVLTALKKIPGLSSVSPASRVPAKFENISKAISEELEKFDTIPKTFRVTTKRSNKAFPMTSMEISRKVGGWVKAEYGLTPKMKGPELTITVRIIENAIYVSTRQIDCTGGLPVGTSGRMVCMLSGGFDSPVASYMMSKRGVDQIFVFFYSHPYVGDEVKKKIICLVEALSPYQRFAPLFIVPFGKIQKNISDNCKQDYRTILFRKYMVKSATILAKKLQAQALITGDALSQVSSQTLENIAVMDQSSDLPIFRPLIGFNKKEIIDLSREIGTHDVSVLPHDDACSLFAPQYPVIRADKKYCLKFEEEFPMESEIERALATSEICYFNKSGEINRSTGPEFFAKSTEYSNL